MRRYFQKILDYLLGRETLTNKDGLPSVDLALKSILGVKAHKQLLSVTPDRRQLMEEAAIFLKISEYELIKKVSEKLDLPAFFQPKSIDLRLLPEGVNAKHLRRAGIFPLISGDLICGIVCVDPAELSKYNHLYSGNNFYLSNWRSILGAIEDSEDLYLKNQRELENTEKSSKLELVHSILEHLLKEVIKKNSECIYFTKSEEGLLYEFKDRSGTLWEGRVNPNIALSLIELLEYKISSECRRIDFSSLEVIAEVEIVEGQFGLRPLSIAESDSARIFPFPLSNHKINTHLESDTFKYLQESLGIQILLVDDNPIFLEVMSKYLERQGFHVIIEASESSALESLVRSKSIVPDLIITDMKFPVVDCTDFIRNLRSSTKFNAIPIIVLTADCNLNNELTALEAGADLFISKSKDLKILKAHLRRLVGIRKAA